MRIEPQDVLAATNGGLDILIMIFPQANSCVGTTKKFKLREHEKTASATIKKQEDGNWIITDFGGTRVSRNGIQWYAAETGLSWPDALNELATKFNVKGSTVEVVTVKPTVESREATTEEKEGFGAYELNTDFTDFEVETIFSKYVLKELGWNKGEEKKKEAYIKILTTCRKYNFYPVKSYTFVKNRKHLTFISTDEYPIFLIDEGDFKKLYQPFHSDKGRRFMYIGGEKKPKDFIHGLAQAKSEYSKRVAEFLSNNDDYEKLTDEEKKKARNKEVEKLTEFIMCSGGSDALNLAVLDYWVGWMNSETAKLQPWDYAELSKITDKVYQLQDIDDTGKLAAHHNALEYLDLYTIELPEALKEKSDRRYNPCKDLRDFFNHFEYYDFKELLKIALPYRFWEKMPEYVGRGDSRVPIGFKYELDNVQAYNFLSKNGFFRLPIEGEKEEYKYVQIDGNIVKETKPVKVKNFIHEFLISRKMEKDLRNKLYNSTRLNESSLSNLPETSIDFTDHDEKRQLIFFKNCTWEVTAEGIKSFAPGVIKNYVWEKNVIDHHAKVIDKSFTITKDEAGVYDIEIHDQKDLFLQLLIQTSRVHWRKEFEDELEGLSIEESEAYRKANHINIAGSKLDTNEVIEQKQHLVNKIFCIGHMLHRFKDPSRSFAIMGMDNKINDDGGSYGGSGKSIILEVGLQKVLKNPFTIAGTSPKVTENPHIYGGLNEHHQYVYIDDMDKYMKFRFFFPLITSDQPCNPKNAQGYVLPFKHVPKVAFTTNFTLMDQSPSALRRINYFVCSDWYHIKGEFSDYKESRDPKSDLGKSLFTEFTREEWNSFYNTMARCLEFYLSTKEIIAPPMDNVSKRNMQSTMGLNFEAWANVFFCEGSDNIDALIVKEEAFEEFNKKNKSLGWSSQKFTAAIKAFCHYHGYELNPAELKNTKDNRIIHRVSERELRRDGWALTGKMASKEFMYIRTDIEIPLNREVPGKEKEPAYQPEQVVTTDQGDADFPI